MNERAKAVQSYDLVHPAKLSRTHLRVVETVLRQLERPWSLVFSSMLGTDVVLQLSSVEQARFGDFAGSLPGPALIARLSLGDVLKDGFLCVPAMLAWETINRAAGGSGAAGERSRGFTRIERAIVRRLLGRLTADLDAAWRPIVQMNAEASDCLEDADELGLAEEDAVVAASFTLTAGSTVHRIDFAVPANSLNAVRDVLTPERLLEGTADKPAGAAPRILTLIESVRLEAVAELGRTKMSMAELAGLNVGDVIRLDRGVNDALLITVQGRSRFCGLPGLVGRKIAIQVLGRDAEDDRP